MADAIIIGQGGSGTGGGGGSVTQYTKGATAATPTGIVAMGQNPSNVIDPLSLDANGYLQVNIKAGSSSGIQYTDGAAETGGAFTVTAAGLYNGTDIVGLRGDASNNLYVNLHTALPAGTNVIGHIIVDSGTLTAVTAITNPLPAGTNLLGQIEVSDGTNVLFSSAHPGYVQFGSAQHVIVDSGGGGGTQYTDGAAESVGGFTITVAGMYNGTDVVGLRADSSNNLYVNLHTALPAGTNVIGHVIIDSGTITAVTAITDALPAGTNVIGHVIIDSGSIAVTNAGTFAVQAAQSGNWSVRNVGNVGGVFDAATGAAVPANALQVGGSDGTDLRAIATDSSGQVKVLVENASGISVAPAQSGTLTDRSSTVATGGTSQQLAATNSSRKYILIQNPPTATENLFINFTSAASTTVNGSIILPPGASFERTLATYMTTEQINVTAATSAHAFVAKEG